MTNIGYDCVILFMPCWKSISTCCIGKHVQWIQLISPSLHLKQRYILREPSHRNVECVYKTARLCAALNIERFLDSYF